MKLIIKPSPRVYSFVVNGMEFQCFVDWREDAGIYPQQILIRDLEECLEQLKIMPRFRVEEQFKLPPLKPEELENGIK